MARVKTGGRVKGSRNKRLKENDAARALAAQLIEAALPDVFEGDAHCLLMATYKNRQLDMRLRVDAAKAALPCEKPRLSHKDVNLKVDASESFVKLWAAISNGSAAEMADSMAQEQE